MRTISADNAAILAKGNGKLACRISIKDAGGTYRDLSTYPGLNLIKEIAWGEDNDSQGVTWSAALTRSHKKRSTAPLMQTSPLNRGFDPAAAYAPLIHAGRMVKIEFSMQARGDPRSRTWAHAFTGYLDVPDSAGEVVKLSGRGLEAPIAMAHIERERVYAFAQGAFATKGAYIWTDPATGSAYTTAVVGDLMLPSGTKQNDHFYRCTAITTGVMGATEPVWPTGGGSTVVDGGVTWTESGATSSTVGTPVETVMQQILNDNLASPPTIWCPVSPVWLIKWFRVTRQSTFAELKILADQIGWCFRYVDDSGTPRLKLYDPNRSTTTSLHTFAPSQINDFKRLSTDWRSIRNAIRIVYSDSQDLASGHSKRKSVIRTDAASITRYQRQFGEIAEASASNIDTLTEATDLADKILSDLAEPEADVEVALVFLFAFVELTDLYTLSADQVRFDADQKLAVASYRHLYNGTDASSTLRLRGKPASNGKKGWFERFSDADGAETHLLSALENIAPLQLSADTLPVGGARISWDQTFPKAPKDTSYELHISTTPGFTPSSSTLVATSKERFVEVGNLDPATDYAVAVIPITWNAHKPVRGSKSVELSFRPGRAQATHISSGIALGDYPLNGGFETRLGAGLPDHWTLYGGSVADVTVKEDANGVSGRRYLRLTNGAGVRSAKIPIVRNGLYQFSLWRKNDATNGAGNWSFILRYLDSAGAEIGTFTQTVAYGDHLGNWRREVFNRVISIGDPTVREVELQLLGPASTNKVDVDEPRLKYLGERWYEIDSGGTTDNDENVPGFGNSWVNYNTGTHAVAAFRKDESGTVRLKGLVASGTVGLPMFTLPIGYRPPKAMNWPCVEGGAAYGRVEIGTGGTVTLITGANGFVSLDQIAFETHE